MFLHLIGDSLRFSTVTSPFSLTVLSLWAKLPAHGRVPCEQRYLGGALDRVSGPPAWATASSCDERYLVSKATNVFLTFSKKPSGGESLTLQSQPHVGVQPVTPPSQIRVCLNMYQPHMRTILPQTHLLQTNTPEWVSCWDVRKETHLSRPLVKYRNKNYTSYIDSNVAQHFIKVPGCEIYLRATETGRFLIGQLLTFTLSYSWGAVRHLIQNTTGLWYQLDGSLAHLGGRWGNSPGMTWIEHISVSHCFKCPINPFLSIAAE